jgi:hypothetical protein
VNGYVDALRKISKNLSTGIFAQPVFSVIENEFGIETINQKHNACPCLSCRWRGEILA